MNKIDILLMSTKDPVYDVPVLTTLLYKVCDNKIYRFDEANRLIRLIVEKALEGKNVHSV